MASELNLVDLVSPPPEVLAHRCRQRADNVHPIPVVVVKLRESVRGGTGGGGICPTSAGPGFGSRGCQKLLREEVKHFVSDWVCELLLLEIYEVSGLDGSSSNVRGLECLDSESVCLHSVRRWARTTLGGKVDEDGIRGDDVRGVWIPFVRHNRCLRPSTYSYPMNKAPHFTEMGWGVPTKEYPFQDFPNLSPRGYSLALRGRVLPGFP